MNKLMMVLSGLIATASLQALAQSAESRTSPKSYSTIEESNLHIAPIFGLNFVNVKGDADSGWSADTGYQMGGLLDFGSSAATFETGLEINQYAIKASSGILNLSVKMNWLSIP